VTILLISSPAIGIVCNVVYATCVRNICVLACSWVLSRVRCDNSSICLQIMVVGV